jgi:nicotinamide mononucleotide transporter
MTWPEIIGTLFGLLSVALTVKAHVACWPSGIVSVAAYAVLFFQIKLYADMLLQLFFLVTSVIGWVMWTRGPSSEGRPITQLTPRQRWQTFGVTAGAVAACAALFSAFTDASLPVLDSAVSGMSVTAQLLLTRKKVESWVLWIVVDVFSIGIYLYKAVYLTAGLYVVFLILATRGLFEWRRAIQGQSTAAFATG